MIAIIINIFVAYKSFKSYGDTKLTQTLLFGITATFIAIAMILLLGEKVFLSVIINPDLGLLFGGIAIVFSGCAVVSIDSFSFNMVFPKRFLIMTLLAALYMASYVIYWIFDEKAVIGEEITFPNGITPIIGYFVTIPLLIIPMLVFFYYAIKVHEESPVGSKRSTILGLGVLVFTIAYTIEIVGLDPIITTIARSFFIVASLLLYWGLFRIKAKL